MTKIRVVLGKCKRVLMDSGQVEGASALPFNSAQGKLLRVTRGKGVKYSRQYAKVREASPCSA